MESITTFYILLTVTSSWAAVNYDADHKLSACPPLGLGVNFEVTTIQTRSRMYGCANLQQDTVVSATPLMNLWLERPVETSVHGHCDDKTNMDHFIFECFSKYEPEEGEKMVGNKKGWNYIKLVERSTPYLKNETSITLLYRCAVYDVHDSPVEGIRIIRMAISEGRTRDKVDTDQCLGLSTTMGQERLPFLAEGQRLWPNGSMYIYMLGGSFLDQANPK